MAITVRCSGCSKKISLDDAFAGGACRCPYCKEINMVGQKGKSGKAKAMKLRSGTRPVSPGARPDSPIEVPRTPVDRPESPTGSVAASTPSPPQPQKQPEHVPMAAPVRFQGLVSLILLGLLLAMLAAAGGAWYVMQQASSRPIEADGAEAPIEADAQTPANGDNGKASDLQGRVVFLFDGSASMRDVVQYLRPLAKMYIDTLADDNEFAIMLSTRDKTTTLDEGYLTPAMLDMQKVEDMLDFEPAGEADIESAIAAAAELNPAPRTVVVFRRDSIANPGELGERLKSKGLRVKVVGIDSTSAAVGSHSILSIVTGATSESFGRDQLHSLVNPSAGAGR